MFASVSKILSRILPKVFNFFIEKRIFNIKLSTIGVFTEIILTILLVCGLLS